MKLLINYDPPLWWAFIIGQGCGYVEYFLAPEGLKKAFDARRNS